LKSQCLMLLLAVSSASASAQTVPEAEPASGRSGTPSFRPRDVFTLPVDFVGDGKRTLGAFPKNLGRSFIGVFSRNNVAPLLIGVVAAGTSSSFDRQVSIELRGQARGFSTAASTAGGFTVMAPAALGLFAAGRFTHDTRLRAFSYDATQALIVNGVYTSIFKSTFRRERPDGSNALSFPSGHTSSAFAMATVAEKHYGWKVGVPSYLAASAIGFSRISNHRHYLSDVLAGATLGVITARAVVRQNGEPVAGRQRSFSLGPMTDVSGAGLGLRGSLSW
jgi:membrane-associated phospholipid phosphatase